MHIISMIDVICHQINIDSSAFVFNNLLSQLLIKIPPRKIINQYKHFNLIMQIVNLTLLAEN
jgi:hypothetical protein